MKTAARCKGCMQWTKQFNYMATHYSADMPQHLIKQSAMM